MKYVLIYKTLFLLCVNNGKNAAFTNSIVIAKKFNDRHEAKKVSKEFNLILKEIVL